MPTHLFLLATAGSGASAPGGNLNVPIGFWIGFCLAVAFLLALDMFVFHRKEHTPSLAESAWWTVFWTSLAVAFNVGVWWWFGDEYAVQFLTGYLVEWSLSMDNVFVFAIIFTYFGVPLKYQYRVLFWGILGAIVMRLTFILAASELLERLDWLMYIFGALLLYTGIKLARSHGAEVHPEQNIVVRFARRNFRITREMHGKHFFVRENGRLFMTPLFLVLLVVETTDVIFAVDSVPAIFGVTRVPFIIFTSNVFAIMGLRALYFLLAGVMDLFRYLHYGLAAVLCFIGLKMLLPLILLGLAKGSAWVGSDEGVELFDGLLRRAEDHALVPHWASLVVIVCLLGISIAASLVAARRERRVESGKAVADSD
jgi:tellurite resistance protein TerC